MKPIQRSPSSLCQWGSLGAGFIAVATSGFFAWTALGVGIVGFALLLVGLIRGSNANVTVGAFGLFLAGLLAGVWGGPVGLVLVSVTAAVLAWDYGGTAISIGEQLGREADTGRLEIVHMASSGTVGMVTAGIGYGLYLGGSGGQPVVALVFLILAAVFLAQALK